MKISACSKKKTLQKQILALATARALYLITPFPVKL
jgi:hypothetical protein